MTVFKKVNTSINKKQILNEKNTIEKNIIENKNKIKNEKKENFINIKKEINNEQANLKLLCDEIFGANNFAANIIWEKADSPRMDAKDLTTA